MKIVNIKQKICVVRRTQNIYYIPQSRQFLKKFKNMYSDGIPWIPNLVIRQKFINKTILKFDREFSKF